MLLNWPRREVKPKNGTKLLNKKHFENVLRHLQGSLFIPNQPCPYPLPSEDFTTLCITGISLCLCPRSPALVSSSQFHLASSLTIRQQIAHFWKEMGGGSWKECGVATSIQHLAASVPLPVSTASLLSHLAIWFYAATAAT